jgi:uncharacterized repeat protein (TIGR03803 family)
MRCKRTPAVLAALNLCGGVALAQTFTKLHEFTSVGGHRPIAPLIEASDGNFYGVTIYGGGTGNGTVFRMDPSGSVTTLHSFVRGVEGSHPVGGLLQGSDGNLYGTASEGSGGYGTVFRMTLGGAFTALHSFVGGDGKFPQAALIEATDGNFYGTTSLGGASNLGTIFKMDAAGNVTTIYSFAGIDGAEPFAPLLQAADGSFYGTTSAGGVDGRGTIFRMDSLGNLTTLHSFFVAEGFGPYAGLVQASDGSFYSTNTVGGGGIGCSQGCGTVFRFDSSGVLTTVHAFDLTEGTFPSGGLVLGTDGSIYGTTNGGGANQHGTVFKIDPAGTLLTLHSLTGLDGAGPIAGPIQASDGNFYGTTSDGGASNQGVIFRVAPCAAYPAPTIAVSACLPAGTPGNVASVQDNPADSYFWTLTGGTIDSGQGTSTISFTSAPAGSLMTLRLVETDSGSCSGAAQVAVQTDFTDVPASNPFHGFICTLARNAITGGCGGGNYCPGDSVLRSQMAVFLLRAKHGSTYLAPLCAAASFGDVPCSDPSASWIYQLVAEGITGGCGGGNFCPSDPVSRNSVAAFLLVAEHGAGYTPSACNPPGQFADVPCPGGGFTDWIYQLVAEGVTGGCTATAYCPGSPVTRAQMAVFLSATFGLP